MSKKTENETQRLVQLQPLVIQLFEHIEELSAEVHNAWWNEKKKQGFHAPRDCKNYGGIIFKKFCDKCHTDMYPYEQLPENIKEYDRVTVRSVLNAIKKVV